MVYPTFHNDGFPNHSLATYGGYDTHVSTYITLRISQKLSGEVWSPFAMSMRTSGDVDTRVITDEVFGLP